MTASDRIAVVTGTSSGIGAALAAALLQAGWSVLGMSRRTADFGSERYEHVQIDLGKLVALRSVAEEILGPRLRETSWQRVGLVNNAATAGASRGLEAANPADLAQILSVDTVAPMFLMGAVTAAAPPPAALRIVNISSGAAVHGLPGLADYCASKAALRLAGMAFAEELESDKRPGGRRADAAILSYEPGVVDTEMQERARSKSNEEFPWNQLFRGFAQRGMLQPAAAVVGPIVDFLASDVAPPFAERRFGES